MDDLHTSYSTRVPTIVEHPLSSGSLTLADDQQETTLFILRLYRIDMCDDADIPGSLNGDNNIFAVVLRPYWWGGGKTA